MERIVPRMTCERHPRYVIVRHDNCPRVMFWTGSGWSRSLRAARLYDDMADVNEVISRLQPPSLFN